MTDLGLYENYRFESISFRAHLSDNIMSFYCVLIGNEGKFVSHIVSELV